uniref:Uncharacterized protein n=1 Tax=Nymphaea colorata TaxID=210225 RepID=A0A5K1HVQ4_9MAGN|nr:unnamed protein product [Nymphaea colorata]
MVVSKKGIKRKGSKLSAAFIEFFDRRGRTSF